MPSIINIAWVFVGGVEGRKCVTPSIEMRVFTINASKTHTVYIKGRCSQMLNSRIHELVT